MSKGAKKDENRTKSMKFDECITLCDHFIQYLTNVSVFGHPPGGQKSTVRMTETCWKLMNVWGDFSIFFYFGRMYQLLATFQALQELSHAHEQTWKQVATRVSERARRTHTSRPTRDEANTRFPFPCWPGLTRALPPKIDEKTKKIMFKMHLKIRSETNMDK